MGSRFVAEFGVVRSFVLLVSGVVIWGEVYSAVLGFVELVFGVPPWAQIVCHVVLVWGLPEIGDWWRRLRAPRRAATSPLYEI